ncbi:hypothetical protein [Geodermatophilus amargosae]|uniref:hypothetical protein n=1 Tax=Geodermatophilus amargosae TaxID=1296565 RepID=UPI0034E02D1C
MAPAPTERSGARPRAVPSRPEVLWRALSWFFVLVAASVLTAFAVLLLTGEYHNEGPVIAVVATGHGLHRGDLFVLAGWAAGMLALLGVVLAHRRGRRAGSGVRDLGAPRRTGRRTGSNR